MQPQKDLVINWVPKLGMRTLVCGYTGRPVAWASPMWPVFAILNKAMNHGERREAILRL